MNKPKTYGKKLQAVKDALQAYNAACNELNADLDKCIKSNDIDFLHEVASEICKYHPKVSRKFYEKIIELEDEIG